MILKTTQQGQVAIEHLLRRMKPKRRWLVFDTETQAKPGYDDDDALVIGRANILVFSMCYMGESYTLPTGLFDPEYPLASEWFRMLAPYLHDRTLVKVFHYANYDLNAFWSEGFEEVKNIWCTLIGAWKANASVDKGLKSRAPLYGRQLRKTSTVDFKNLGELSLYAEEDVISTDELYQMQMYGYVDRPAVILYPNLMPGWTVRKKNPLPAEALGRIVVPNEDLNLREKREIWYQELPYLRATIRAERRGFPFDTKLLHKIRRQLATDREEALKKIFKTAGRTLNIASHPQLAELFNDLGIQSPDRTKKGKSSFKAQSLFKMQEEHPIVGQILNYRALDKMQSVYVGDPFSSNPEESMGLEYYVCRKAGVIRASSNTVGAVTGRTTSSNPNLTQLPSAKDKYKLRDCFIPPKGQSLIVLDQAQLELRVSTLYHQDPVMIKILTDPEGDLHQNTSDEFGVDRDPTAKQINFLLVFGGGPYVLSEKLTTEGVPTDTHQAAAYIDRYDEVYERVRPWRNYIVQYHQAHGFVYLFNHRTRALIDIRWENPRELHKAETTLANNTVQGFGQDLIKASVIRADPECINPDEMAVRFCDLKGSHKNIIKDYAKKLEKYRRKIRQSHCRWLLQVHDENVWAVDSEAAPEILAILADIMTWRHYFQPLDKYVVPLVVDGGFGETWRAAKSKDNKNRVHAGFENWEPV